MGDRECGEKGVGVGSPYQGVNSPCCFQGVFHKCLFVRCWVAISSKFSHSLLKGGGEAPKTEEAKEMEVAQNDKPALKSGKEGLSGRAACRLGRELQGCSFLETISMGRDRL